MNRLLLLIALAVAVYYALNLGWRLLASSLREIEGGSGSSPDRVRNSGRSRGASGPPAELVPCAHCGVHVPKERARRAPPGRAEAFYCSDACRDQA